MSKRHSVCFVDDDHDELDRFKAALGNRFFVGVGTSLDEAIGDLPTECAGRVELFVLDMYFPTAGENSDEQRLKLGKAWDKFCNADRVLKNVLSELGQSFAGGRKLAQDIKSKRVGRIPFVFFTRKGNLIDAIEAYEQVGALSVIKKPDPRCSVPDSETERKAVYDEAMTTNADAIARDIESAIRRGSRWFRYKGLLLGFGLGVASSLVAWILTQFIG